MENVSIFLWYLMESEAIESFYLELGTGEYAKIPAIIICTGYLRAPNAKRNENFTLYFGQGLAHFNFKKLEEAKRKAEDILNTSKREIGVKIINSRLDHPAYWVAAKGKNVVAKQE